MTTSCMLRTSDEVLSNLGHGIVSDLPKVKRCGKVVLTMDIRAGSLRASSTRSAKPSTNGKRIVVKIIDVIGTWG